LYFLQSPLQQATKADLRYLKATRQLIDMGDKHFPNINFSFS
jgi:hypothetical protein